MSSRLRLLAAAAATIACVVAAYPGAASATCYSSTQTVRSFSDTVGDGYGLAPEIARVDAAADSGCGVAFNPVIAEGVLIDGDSVGVYLNTDGNVATGDPVWDGADRVVITIGYSGPDSPPGLGVWNGYDFTFGSNPFLTPFDTAGFLASMDQLGVPASTAIGIETISLYSGIYDDYTDFAPEIGAGFFGFPVSFSTTPPPPPQSGGQVQGAKGCTVPSVRGLRALKGMTKLNNAGCAYKVKRVYSSKRSGRIVSTRPGAGNQTADTVVVKVSRGRRRVGASAAAVGRYMAVEDAFSALARGRR